MIMCKLYDSTRQFYAFIETKRYFYYTVYQKYTQEKSISAMSKSTFYRKIKNRSFDMHELGIIECAVESN